MLLLIDSNYLAYRAYYTTGRLENGTVFGFLSALQKLREQFHPDRIAFCFDGEGRPKRKEIYSNYKGGRKSSDEDDKKEVRKQIRKLRDSWLSEMGWSNVFHQKGYEADDVIASIVRQGRSGEDLIGIWEEVVMVSADHDLYQLLSPSVSIWHPQKKQMVTEESFHNEWGIEPRQWANVKAIAGCSSDNVPGIRGIGEKTAAKYLAARWDRILQNKTTKRMQTIREKMKANADLIKFNLKLVGLPFEGIGEFKIREDQATATRWREWCRKNGMKSLERRSFDRTLFGGEK